MPGRIVAVAARMLRGDRREWGEAMVAELEQLPDTPSRWRFAVGCARVALLAPPAPNAGAPGITITLTFLVGVAGCIAATAIVLTSWPHAGGEISRGVGIWFAASLVTYLWIAMRPPGVLVSHKDAARRGVVIGAILFLVTTVGRTIIDAVVPPSNGDGILGLFLVITVVGTFSATAFLHARSERSFGSGVTAALWAGLVCSLLAFNADLFAILAGFQLDIHMCHVMPDSYMSVTREEFMSRHMGGHLASSMEGLGTVPPLALAIGIIGAAFGRRRQPDSALPLSAGL